jgi:hypothetical protein
MDIWDSVIEWLTLQIPEPPPQPPPTEEKGKKDDSGVLVLDLNGEETL